MKKADKIIIPIIALLLILAIIPVGLKTIPQWFEKKPKPNITSQKIPFKAEISNPDKSIVNFYSTERDGKYPFALNPWSMKNFGGKVFIGCGDYDKNSGYTPIYFYNPETEKIELADTLSSEQISRFYIFDNTLYSTAIDPIVGGRGEFYSKTSNSDFNKFEFYNVLPSNVHCYDMADFDNKFFFCGSVSDYENCSMVQYIDKSDMPVSDKENTKQMFLYKNGEKIPTETCYRVYEMFVYKNKLYVWHLSYSYENGYTGLYVYNKDENRFDYIEGEKTIQPVIMHRDDNIDFMYTQEKLVYNEKQVFVCNGLFYTDNLKDYTTCSFGKGYENYVAKDALVIDNQLYIVACQKQLDGSYKNSVFVTDNLEVFSEVLYFETESYITSFEYTDKTFIFGEGGLRKNTAKSCGNLYTCKIN